MPFDAQRAQRTLQASASLDAKLSEQAEAAANAAPAAPAAAPAPVAAAAPSASRQFQRSSDRPAPPVAQTPVPAASPSEAGRFQRQGASSPAPGPSVASRFQRSGAPDRAASPRSAERPAPPAPAPSPRSDSRPAPQRPTAHYEDGAQAPYAPPLQSRGYVNRVGAPRTPSIPGLTPRLELYIDELGFQKGWSNDEVLRRKHEAAQRPVEAEREYRAQFDEIRRLRQETVQSLQQGLQSRPDQVLFVVQRGEQRRFSALPKERAGSYALLHGSAFHSMPASATLFEAPEVLFARPAVTVEASSIEAEAAAPAASEGHVENRASRAPRP